MKIEAQTGYICSAGVSRINGAINFALEVDRPENEVCSLHLYKDLSAKRGISFDFLSSASHGKLRTMLLNGIDDSYIAYEIKCKDEILVDKRAILISGRSKFAKRNNARILSLLPSKNEFNWENDRHLNLDPGEVVSYKLNVRSFTKGLKTENAGTFSAIIDKIPYFKSIGVNQIELMPAYDFDEIENLDDEKHIHDNISQKNKSKQILNCWGYKEAYYYAVKSSYAYANPIDEFKSMVKKLHEAGIEVIMEFYFTKDTAVSEVINIVRYWVSYYHIDGVHILSSRLMGSELFDDPMLCNHKLYVEFTYETGADVLNYNSGFLISARKFIKGDDYSTQAFLDNLMADSYGRVNYFAGHDGFTLADCFSYERKHNERNGFENADGTDCNYTWNCGKEGISKSKKIVDLRSKQIRNALFLLLLSRGIPRIMAGDEMARSQKGNNNAFCLDNSLSYVNWNDLDKNADIVDFFKECVSFRKAHPILSCNKGQMLGKSELGWPAISFHSKMAWNFRAFGYVKSVGVLYNGQCYKAEKDTKKDNIIYLGYNMYFEEYGLALPNLPDDFTWKICLYTDSDVRIVDDTLLMPPRSCAALEMTKGGNKRDNKKRR